MEKFIEIIKYIILGLVQGITEPLPVSSSGHMIIADSIFGNIISPSAMNNFQIIVNFASLIAIIIYYRNMLKELIVGSFNYVFKKKEEDKHHFIYVLLIFLASIPAGILGVIIKIYELDQYYTNILCVGICLFITGLLLLYVHHNAADATRNEITWKDSLLMGAGQAIGLLPGISRSGITTSFGITNKVSIEAAFRFSFMMYIPASLGATLLGVYDLTKDSSSSIDSPIGLLFSFIASLVGTYFAIKAFFKLIKNRNLKYFAYYCLTISVIVIVLIATGVFNL
jgi:undecaprenyl-diphosphatase